MDNTLTVSAEYRFIAKLVVTFCQLQVLERLGTRLGRSEASIPRKIRVVGEPEDAAQLFN